MTDTNAGAPAGPAAGEHPSDGAISPLLSTRRSIRAFDPARPVSDAALSALVEAARSAPSAHNHQPWRLWIARRGAAEFDVLLGSLESYNSLWAHRAAALIVGIAIEQAGTESHPWAVYDLGQATALLTVEATRRGIGVCQMAGRDVDAIGELVGLAEGEQVGIVSAIGYPGAAAALEPETAALERRAATRKPLSETVIIRG